MHKHVISIRASAKTAARIIKSVFVVNIRVLPERFDVVVYLSDCAEYFAGEGLKSVFGVVLIPMHHASPRERLP
jgi:hypothetical protein